MRDPNLKRAVLLPRQNFSISEVWAAKFPLTKLGKRARLNIQKFHLHFLGPFRALRGWMEVFATVAINHQEKRHTKNIVKGKAEKWMLQQCSKLWRTKNCR